MILGLEANDGATLPCGCAVHDTKVFHNGRELDDVVAVRCERGDPMLYGPRVIVWTITMHSTNPDGTVKTVEDEHGRRPLMKLLHVAELDGPVVELRCKHHERFTP